MKPAVPAAGPSKKAANSPANFDGIETARKNNTGIRIPVANPLSSFVQYKQIIEAKKGTSKAAKTPSQESRTPDKLLTLPASKMKSP